MVLTFAEARQPEYREKKGEGEGYIEFGKKNDYPNYLVDLFNKSAKHNAIIKGKVNYITGNGFKIKEGIDPIGEQFIAQANRVESLTEVLRKASIDIELFGGAYLQIIWSVTGKILLRFITLIIQRFVQMLTILSFGIPRIGKIESTKERSLTDLILH